MDNNSYTNKTTSLYWNDLIFFDHSGSKTVQIRLQNICVIPVDTNLI